MWTMGVFRLDEHNKLEEEDGLLWEDKKCKRE